MPLPQSHEEIYGDLFKIVQSRHVFEDSKTFVDATPRSDVASILNAFTAIDQEDTAAIRRFVEKHFMLPEHDNDVVTSNGTELVREHIEKLWDALSRTADHVDPNSSLIELPRPYVVPGGRFREIYYWDSYFTMLGLAQSGRFDAIEDMVENFAYLIDRIGFIPNGNRSYFCTRSQPPYFALMVELLAETRADDDILRKYLPQLKREYEFWMSGAETLKNDGDATRRVVQLNGAYLNRYWDDSDTPRPESYAEDLEHAARSNRPASEYYRDIRAACESGWDFSPRWFEDQQSIETIRTTQVIPVDLNTLMFNIETTLARICRAQGDVKDAAVYEASAEQRKILLQTLFFDDSSGTFMDLLLPDFNVTKTLSIATMYPLFFGIATEEQAKRVEQCVRSEFLKVGGWVTSNYYSGQQWDSPNGWAPMQWVTYRGLERYGFHETAEEGATRWVEANIAAYKQHGRFLEKYNVESSGLAGTGGEYEVQDGFGWTNAVLLLLMQKLGKES